MEKDDVYEELQDVIGEEAAKRFVEHYSGSNLYTPHRILLKERHKKIREEFESGASYKELALKYGYSEQHVREITRNKK